MMVEVMLNLDSILDFPKCPYIFSISHLKYQSWILVYTFEFQNGHVMSPANELQGVSFASDISNGKYSKYVDILENL